MDARPHGERPDRRTVLVVDHDPARRSALRDRYDAEGFQVITCPGGNLTDCPGAHNPPGACPRVRDDLFLVVLGPGSDQCVVVAPPGAGTAATS